MINHCKDCLEWVILVKASQLDRRGAKGEGGLWKRLFELTALEAIAGKPVKQPAKLSRPGSVFRPLASERRPHVLVPIFTGLGQGPATMERSGQPEGAGLFDRRECMSERIKARFAAIALAGLAAALVLAFQVFPSGALAQEKGDLRQDAASNSYAPELPNLGVVTVTVAAIDGFCKSIKYQATLSRPFGSFNAAFDELSASEIGKELALIEKNLLELDDPAECANLTDQKDPVEVERTFKAHSPNPNVISVLYTYFFSSPWAAHHFTKFETVNFDLAESRELTLNDVIPSSSLEALWAEVAKCWCSYTANNSIPYL